MITVAYHSILFPILALLTKIGSHVSHFISEMHFPYIYYQNCVMLFRNSVVCYDKLYCVVDSRMKNEFGALVELY